MATLRPVPVGHLILYFNSPHAASVLGKNEEVASLGDPAPSEPVVSLTHGRVIVSRENFGVVSRGLLAGSGITDDRRYIALQYSPKPWLAFSL